MDDLPLPVLGYINTSLIGPRKPAYLHIDIEHRLVDWGGQLIAYGITEPKRGQAIEKQLLFLEGLLPMQTSTLCLPWVQIQPGSYADIHLFSSETGWWILLLDATPEATRHAQMQQRVNDVRLDAEKTDRLHRIKGWTDMPLPPQERFPGGREHILFVDDEPLLLCLGRKVLEPLGYHVVTHTDSRAALEAIRAAPQSFDLVITDQVMHEMSGTTFVQELRHIRLDLPVILYTGYSDAMTAERAQELGVQAFLTKPLVLCDLVRAIRHVIDQSR